MSEWVMVHLGEHFEESVELVYNLNLAGEDHRGYFVRLDDWEVFDAFVAE